MLEETFVVLGRHGVEAKRDVEAALRTNREVGDYCILTANRPPNNVADEQVIIGPTRYTDNANRIKFDSDWAGLSPFTRANRKQVLCLDFVYNRLASS